MLITVLPRPVPASTPASLERTVRKAGSSVTMITITSDSAASRAGELNAVIPCS